MPVRNVSFAPGTKGDENAELRMLQEKVKKIEVSLGENMLFQRQIQSKLENLERLMTRSPRSPRGSPGRSPQQPGSPGYTGCRKCGSEEHYARDCPKV